MGAGANGRGGERAIWRRAVGLGCRGAGETGSRGEEAKERKGAWELGRRPRTRLEADDAEADGAGGKTKGDIMGGHHENSGRLLTPEYGGRKVDGIESAQGNSLRLRRAHEDQARDIHDGHSVEDPVDRLTPSDDLRFGDSLDEP